MKKISRTTSFSALNTRGLHLFIKKRPEVAIVNNSGLFFTLATLREHTKESHPDLHIIMPEFWLDNTHKDFNDLDWGQTPLGLPWYVRNEFHKTYNNHGKHEYIRWGQVKELRRFVVSELKSLGAAIYSGIPKISSVDNQYKIHTNEKTFSINKKCNHFYNSFRAPITNHGFGELDGDSYKCAHTDLYNSSLDETKNETIIVLGSGRSVIWLAKHFPNLPIASIGYDHPRKSLFSDEKLPNNIIFYDKNEFSTKFNLKPIDPTQGIALISAINSADSGENFIGNSMRQ